MGTPMNFSTVLMNPPYGNTHLKVLKNVIETLPDAQIVSLQPVRWLQDPLAENKKNSDFNKMKPVLKDKIESVYIIDRKDATELFKLDGTGFQMELGIFNIKKSKVPYDSLLLRKKEISILNKIKELNTPKVIPYSKCNKKNFVPIVLMLGHLTQDSKPTIHRPRYGYFADGKTAGNGTFGDCHTFDESKSYNLMHPDRMPVIEFKTGNEAKNFYGYINLSAFRFFVWATMNDTHVQLKRLPFVKDYTALWTNKRFYEYFNLTDDEIKIIEDWISENK